MEYLWLKWIHILSSTILFGTGIGIAFFKLWCDRHGELRAQSVVMRAVVLTDWIFTTPAIVIQAATGVRLAHIAGYPLTQGWVLWSIVLYLFAGACWLPVVWLQIGMRNQVRAALETETVLSAGYDRYNRVWIALGIPAFSALVVIFWLMVFKPDA
jgi:uncharacterized membrane protein